MKNSLGGGGNPPPRVLCLQRKSMHELFAWMDYSIIICRGVRNIIWKPGKTKASFICPYTDAVLSRTNGTSTFIVLIPTPNWSSDSMEALACPIHLTLRCLLQVYCRNPRHLPHSSFDGAGYWGLCDPDLLPFVPIADTLNRCLLVMSSASHSKLRIPKSLSREILDDSGDIQEEGIFYFVVEGKRLSQGKCLSRVLLLADLVSCWNKLEEDLKTNPVSRPLYSKAYYLQFMSFNPRQSFSQNGSWAV